VGQRTWADRVVDLLAPDKFLIGMDSAELDAAGRARYPEIRPTLNRPGHAMGAFILTRRFGFVAAQTLGIANEVWEAWVLAPYVKAPYFSEPRFDWGDVGANVYGGIDAETSDRNSLFGLVWLAWMLYERLEGLLLDRMGRNEALSAAQVPPRGAEREQRGKGETILGMLREEKRR
jgi:hypothetical protein